MICQSLIFLVFHCFSFLHVDIVTQCLWWEWNYCHHQATYCFFSVAFGPDLTLEHFHILRYYWTNFDYIWSIVTYCLRATTKTSTIQTLRIFLLLDIHETNSVHNHIEQGSFIVKCCYNVCIFGILQGPIWTRAQNTRRAFYSLQQNDGHISITDVHELPTQMS